MSVKSYKDLIIWQRSMDLVELIYLITEDFPSKENFGLTSQMRRAAVAVPSNIAEGYGRQSTGSYSQFLSIARGSLFELETQVEICTRLKYFNKTESEKLTSEIVEISKMISSLISKLH
ncbi:MAG: four helix bundle protein [Bacteroidetes bacterium RBG_13_42_15]|nr:MAG: four helix bundle protein [Bacteroidetes bacterium RBG_13_42_15]